jgi:hypothetical protein
MEIKITGLDSIQWDRVRARVDQRGYDVVPSIIDEATCAGLIGLYHQAQLFRKTVSMERFRFGRGEYKYFTYPLPALIHSLRERLYAELVPVANAWMRNLNIDVEYPVNHREFVGYCRTRGQEKATVLILKYGEGGFNTLHQDLYGDVYFPFQVVLFLNRPDEDYSGGEFVLTEQIPRAQSKAIVLKPGIGDMLVFTTNFRPVQGSRGYYRVSMKHGVSEIHSGIRHTLGIIFHDAAS